MTHSKALADERRECFLRPLCLLWLPRRELELQTMVPGLEQRDRRPLLGAPLHLVKWRVIRFASAVLHELLRLHLLRDCLIKLLLGQRLHSNTLHGHLNLGLVHLILQILLRVGALQGELLLSIHEGRVVLLVQLWKPLCKVAGVVVGHDQLQAVRRNLGASTRHLVHFLLERRFELPIEAVELIELLEF